MALEFDKDERAVSDYIKSHGNAFNSIDPFAVVSARTELAELMLDARIESAVTYGKLTHNEAEKLILEELEKSKA